MNPTSRAGIVYKRPFQPVIGTATRLILIGRDPGGGDANRDVLQQSLNATGSKANLRFEGLDYRVIEQISDDIDKHYLDRWATALVDQNSRPGPERTARAIASHLLDQGFSRGFLHRWWTYQVKHDSKEYSLADLTSMISRRSEEPRRKFDVLMAFPSRLEPSSSSARPLTDVKLGLWLKQSRRSMHIRDIPRSRS